jgi:prepilin-type N-terminal cleavage/methylation domain-containing protein
MIRAHKTPSRRAGFTLVEVLVVVAIIAILVSLTAAAVFKIYGKGDELQARSDISNLSIGVEAFKLKMQVDYLPSRFRLREDLYGYVNPLTADYLDSESWTYLKKLFPKIPQPSAAYPNPGSVWMDWNGTGTLDAPVDLEGHQCLVFFLGGIPTYAPNNVLGFSTNPGYPAPTVYVPLTGPAQTIPMTTERVGPFFQFKSNQLVALPTPPLKAPSVINPTTGGGYFSMLDPWGVNPYIYFSGYKKNNGYNRYYAYYYGTAAGQLGLTWGTASDNICVVSEDRVTLSPSNPQAGTFYPVWPYAFGGGANATYSNPLTYQIICSGADKVFGQGTLMKFNGTVWAPTPTNSTWSPATASNQTPKGRDDFSNFHDRQLGSGD